MNKNKVVNMLIQYKKMVSITGLVVVISVLGACYGTKAQRVYDLDVLEKKDNIRPIVIIGSGPAGLSAAIYGARANRSTLVIEGGEPGGLLTKTTTVENWPGEVSIQGPDIVKKMREHAHHLGVDFLADSVESVDFTQWPFVITTGDGITIHALTVIIATGANPRMLGIPGEDLSGVSACAVCDAPFFKKNEDVVVIGGGDSAVEEAIQLASFVNSVTILVRGPQMRAAASMQDRLKKEYSNIKVRYNTKPLEVVGDGDKVTGILVDDSELKKQETIPVTGVFLGIGHIPNSQLFEGKLELDEGGYIMLRGRSQETSVDGVFAAGDVEDHVYRQARVAEGSGVKAALDAESFLQEIGFTTARAEQIKSNMFRTKKRSSGVTLHVLESVKDFNDLVSKSDGVVILDFYTDYCPSCLHMLPAYEAVADEYAGQAAFAKVDAEKAIDLVAKFYVQRVPCILVFSKGKLIGRFNQAMDKQELRDLVEKFLKS